MIVMYPLNAQDDYTELLYSLRSLDKFLHPDEVIIVGDKVPYWLNNVTQIGLPNVPGRKQLSIRTKILAALEYAEEILFMNDDIYLLETPKDFPYYYQGGLKSMAESGSKPLLKQLEAMSNPTKNFDGHYPLIYDRTAFKIASDNFSDDCIIKSMYCNYWELPGIEKEDCKVLKAAKPEQIREFIKDKPCFSTGVYSLNPALPVLQELFPLPSRYEI